MGNLNRAEQVCIKLTLDLCVPDFFGSAEQSIAGVAHDDVDALQFRKRAVDDLTYCRCIRDIKDGEPKTFTVLRSNALESIGLTNRRRDPVAALEEKLGKFPSKPATSTCDEPCFRHRNVLSLD